LLGEDPERLETIACNDDNPTYRAIVGVSTGPLRTGFASMLPSPADTERCGGNKGLSRKRAKWHGLPMNGQSRIGFVPQLKFGEHPCVSVFMAQAVLSGGAMTPLP